MKNFVTFIAMVFLLTSGCSTTKRVKYSDEEIAAFKANVVTKKFEITATVANPLGTQAVNAVLGSGLLPPQSTVGRIDLVGISNFLMVKGDSVSAALPYYGERQFGSAYNNRRVGIDFEQGDTVVDLKYDDKKKAYTFRFKANNETENLMVNGWLFPNGRATLFINSSERNTIGYAGKYTFLE